MFKPSLVSSCFSLLIIHLARFRFLFDSQIPAPNRPTVSAVIKWARSLWQKRLERFQALMRVFLFPKIIYHSRFPGSSSKLPPRSDKIVYLPHSGATLLWLTVTNHVPQTCGRSLMFWFTVKASVIVFLSVRIYNDCEGILHVQSKVWPECHKAWLPIKISISFIC